MTSSTHCTLQNQSRDRICSLDFKRRLQSVDFRPCVPQLNEDFQPLPGLGEAIAWSRCTTFGKFQYGKKFQSPRVRETVWYPIEKGTPILSNVFNPFIYRLVWLLNPENRRFRCTTLVYANNNPSSFWPRLSHQCVVEELEAPWLGVWFWRGIVNGTGDSWKHTFLVDGFAKWTSESWRTFHP